MTSMHGNRLWPAALLALSACIPDSVSPDDYGVAEEAGEATTADPSTAATSSDPTLTGHVDDSGASPDGGRSDGRATAVTANGCDLTGRWLATDRELATALGAKEAAHTWLYYEISQAGAQLTVTKGLDCGEDVVGISSASGNVDYHKTWPAILSKATQTGRKGTSAPSGSGCAVSFEKRYQVIGATVSAYLDPTQAMPAASQEAASGSPGWEDWDNDGHPGFTMNVSGLVTGQIYIATRRWNAFSAAIPPGSTSFTLSDNWGSEQDLLGYSGSSLLTATTTGTRDSDASEHFVTFARLTATQATGDDTTTCAAIRALAPSLAPKASN